MRYLLVLVLMVGLAGLATANTDNHPNLEMKDILVGSNPAYDDREGGETIGDAVAIPGLPYNDTGATCDNINDYDEICPYSGSTSPDVVYSYAPAADEAITIDLCYSSYDTKVYVYDDGLNLVACNDDFYFAAPCWTYSSAIEDLPVFAGTTYYIVVDGYGGDCGTYVLDVIPAAGPCVLECPDGALLEGEPELVDDYVDNYNGGCNSAPPVFQVLEAQADDCLTMCAISGWYLYQGSSYRDTDWFVAEAVGTLVDFGVEAEYPVNMFVLNTDCGNIVLLYDLSIQDCDPGLISYPTTPGQINWLWVGPQAFSGPVYEFDYIMDVCGIVGGVVPTVDTSWGTIKNMYK